jgi:wyosine [tRNA(Phe)-imidazoG37] synthetase (radical SAM superfamily)
VIRGYSVGVEILNAHRQHSRRFEDFKYVYPVLSRRSHGISIGLNVNPDKVCNFDCIYCQVDRTTESAVKKFDVAAAEQELREMVEMVRSGEIAQHAPFNSVRSELLRLNDIALSGDAEPTTLPNFAETMAMVARIKPPDAKIVLITDAGGLDRADVKRGLEIMDANNGEVWAKLDAGTEKYFKVINRTKIPFARILKNIAETAKVRPMVIQSLFLKIRGEGPSSEEIGAYCQRLREIGNINPARRGIKLVQVYTIARKAMTVVDSVPAWKFVSALTNTEVDAITERVRKEAGVKAESFYGQS